MSPTGGGATDGALPIGRYDRDEGLIAYTRRARAPALRCYRYDGVAVVLGRGSKAELELDVAACRADGVPVLRRRGGGCAVVLDPGNAVVSLTYPTAQLGKIDRYFGTLSTWMGRGLARAGAPGVVQRGISDLAIGERKIGGSCLYLARDVLFYSTTLLVSPDIPLMARYLRHPPREPDYRAGRAHADFIGTLAELADVRGPAELAAALESVLGLPDLG